VKEFDEILELIKTLRSENGDYWDREQTIESLKEDLQEELEEVIQAIDNDDKENLKEEIGDLIWALFLMVEIASEKNHFNAEDVLKSTRDKIIRRHPHVFGDEKAETPEDAMRIIQKVKESEKNGLQNIKKQA